jgi:CDP-paratose 2-epimerase
VKKYLITGGCGFLGSNIAAQILKQGQELVVFDSLYRFGSSQNLEWLKTQSEFEFIHGDVRNFNNVERMIQKHTPDVIYHLAGQVAMTTSIEDPRLDFEVNVVGTFNLLNAVRLYSPLSTIIYSSTNKVYGRLEQFTYEETQSRYICVEHKNGIDENVNLDFQSPYGVSKGSADQYMLDFSRIYGLNTVVFRHSSIYGGRQYSTYNQGWIGWFIQQANNIKNNNKSNLFTISGNGKQVRDIAHADDIVSLYIKAPTKIETIKGQAFNIGGGVDNSLSILELFSFLEKELNIKMNYTEIPVRKSDQKVFISNLSKVKELIGLEIKISKEDGIRKMIDWVSTEVAPKSRTVSLMS